MWRVPHTVLHAALWLIHHMGYEVFDPTDGHDRTSKLDVARIGEGW